MLLISALQNVSIFFSKKLLTRSHAPRGNQKKCYSDTQGFVNLAINSFDINGIEFSKSGVLHYSRPDNVYQYVNNVSTALIKGTASPMQDTLELSGVIYASQYQVSYVRDKLGRIIQKTELSEGVTIASGITGELAKSIIGRLNDCPDECR